MHHHYQDYYWKMGKPYGLGLATPSDHLSYKIVTDPYHKRYSIEKYHDHSFQEVIYDSIFLDFRHLKPHDQLAWQKECLDEQADSVIYLLRNQEDRVILIETQQFQQNLCRSCSISSVHGILISTHRLYYTTFGDPFNGVILYDKEEKPVMKKTYQTDPDTGEFTSLLAEEWDMHTV